MRKVCIVTGTRAEYGLLYWLMKGIQESLSLELQVIATGMHMSSEFGMTYREIEKDNFVINKKIEMLLSSDTEIGITKSMGIGLINFAETFDDLKPDLIVVLGDRFELLVVATAATVAKIPIAHIHGGETTEGAFDESFRHSISKMSHLHFTANEKYKRRVVQLGENPDRVYCFGGTGIDNILYLNLLNREQLEESINFKLGEKNLLITFHPVTLENSTSEGQFSNLLHVLENLNDTHLIFTKANADTDGRIINRMIDKFVSRNSATTISFTSLGQLRYLSTIQFVDGVIGNSSSGLLEVPTFKKGTINIGDRQNGRLKATSVIDCQPSKDSIENALFKLYSKKFQSSLNGVVNPYGKGGASAHIVNVIEKVNLDGILKKNFYDISFKYGL